MDDNALALSGELLAVWLIDAVAGAQHLQHDVCAEFVWEVKSKFLLC